VEVLFKIITRPSIRLFGRVPQNAYLLKQKLSKLLRILQLVYYLTKFMQASF